MSEFSCKLRLPDLPAKGRAGLFLDPRTKTIYSSDGTTEEQPITVVGFGTDVLLGWVPSSTASESFMQWIPSQEETLLRIVAGFSLSGSVGSPRGQWTRSAMFAVDLFGTRLSQACRDRRIGCWWRSVEYFHGEGLPSILNRIESAATLEGFVEREVVEAKANNVWLDVKETLEYFRILLMARREQVDRVVGSWSEAIRERALLEHALASDTVSTTTDDEALLQKRITQRIRKGREQDVRCATKIFRAEQDSQFAEILWASLRAAALDERIWASLCHVRQVVVAEQDL